MNHFKRRSRKKKHSLLVSSLNRRHRLKTKFDFIFKMIVELVIEECNYGINRLNLTEDQQQ
jgi:hypothetical protein